MNFMKEPLYQKILNQPYELVMQQVQKKLSESRIEVLKVDGLSGEIIVHCLTNLFNIFIWRCWGDKVLFKFKPPSVNKTEVALYGIANWCKLGLKNNEKIYSRDELGSLRKI